MTPRFINVYFVPLPDPIGISPNISLHFVYDERRTPYFATPAVDENPADLLLRVGSANDVAVSFTHVPTAPDDSQLRSAAALSALQYFRHEAPVVEEVDPGSLSRLNGEFRATRVITVAEIAVFDSTPADAPQVDTEIEDISDPLLRSLHCIEHLIHAYNLSADRPARAPKYAVVGPSIPVLRRSLTTPSSEWGLHVQPLNHDNIVGRPPKVLEPEAIRQVLMNVQLLSAGDLRTIYQRALIDAERLIVDGDYAGSIVKCAQACEILFDGILGLMLWEEIGGAPRADGPIEAAAEILARPLVSKVRREYHPRLGGMWDPTGEGPVGGWSRSVAATRNRIVHRGYQPLADEAADALNATHTLDDYITGLLAAHARKFPRTALMWVTDEGLKDRGRWPLVRSFSRDKRRTEPPWRDSYSSWRDRVDAGVSPGKKRSPPSSAP